MDQFSVNSNSLFTSVLLLKWFRKKYTYTYMYTYIRREKKGLLLLNPGEGYLGIYFTIPSTFLYV